MPTESKDAFKANVQEVSLPKGHVVIDAGKIENHIYFIRKGITRAFADKPNGPVTFWFGQEGDMVISMRSYVENKEGYENIELLEDCELYKIRIPKLQSLFDVDPYIANWGRRLMERELLKTEERLISMQFKSALERYQELLELQPNLLQRVQLGHIASYLGISQVSLSRIRATVRY